MFKNMTVGARLLAGFMLIALIGAAVAGIGIYNMAQMRQQAENAYKLDLQGMAHTKEANIGLMQIGRAMRGLLLASSAADRARFVEQVAASRRGTRASMDSARPLFTTAAAQALYAEADAALADYAGTVEEVVRRAAAADTPEAHQSVVDYALGTVGARSAVADAKLGAMVQLKDKTAAEYAAQAAQRYQSSSLLMAVLVAGTLALGGGLGYLITNGLTRQLGGEPHYARRIASAIASGDLGVDIALRPGDDSSLLAAMRTMRDSLVAIVGDVRASTDTISHASAEIASGNMDLSSRTEMQASSLEETASSMEELTSTVKQNSDSAERANTLAQSAADVAVKGGQVVSQVMSTMASINQSSSRIEAIIGVIDGIAFQTNILALNAAVEAARAGEQGRGFAVVASEVRNLAQRSAAAAKEIKTLIDDSVEQVGAGGKLVDQAGMTMDEIVQSISRVTGIMAEIASASREQTMGIEQVNQAIAEMDQATQQNAALVEQAAAAAASMQDEAASLAQAVSVFKLEGARPAARRSGPAQPRPAKGKAALRLA